MKDQKEAQMAQIDALAQALFKAMHKHCSKHRVHDIDIVISTLTSMLAYYLAGFDEEDLPKTFGDIGLAMRIGIAGHKAGGTGASIHQVHGTPERPQ